jgi:hypothetical protein
LTLAVPSGRTLKWSEELILTRDPSEPVACRLKVKVPLTTWLFWLNPPQMVTLPV